MTDFVDPVADRDKVCFEQHPEDGDGRVCVRPKGHPPLAHPINELFAYDGILRLMLNNVHIGVSGEDIVVDTQRFPAPSHLREALIRLLEDL